MPALTGYAPPTRAAAPLMGSEQFGQLSRQQQLDYLRANGAANALGPANGQGTSNPKLAAMRANSLSPELQALYHSVKSDGGTFFGGLLHDAAPYALAAGAVAAAPAVIGQLGGGATGGGLGIFSNGGAGGLAGVGGGNAGALAASGGILGGAGVGGTTAGALGGLGTILNSGNITNAQRVAGLLGGGNSSQQAPQIPYGLNLGSLRQPQQQQMSGPALGQAQLPGIGGMVTPYGRRAHNFQGATVWL